jgi:hypothetical protein
MEPLVKETEFLVKETEPLLDHLLELGVFIEPWINEHHSETIEAVMEFVGKVRALLTKLKN